MRRFKAFEASPTIEFKDPDTGYMFRANNLKNLYVDIIKYRAQNNLEPVEYLREVVENYLCGLPENCNKCQENDKLSRSISQYVRGGIALLKNMAYPRFVTQAVAEERAEQCIKCPNNIFPDKGPFLAWSDEIAIQQVGERKSVHHEDLGSCKVCTCTLKSKVFFGGALSEFPSEELVELKKVNCWQLKITGQDR